MAEFECETRENGKRRIYRTDDEGDFIRFNLVEYISVYAAAVTVKVDALGDRWFRVEVAYPADIDWQVCNDISTDLSIAFRDKGWYEHRKEGANDDGSIEWHEVRHIGGAWI